METANMFGVKSTRKYYDTTFCACGTIHFTPVKKLIEVLEDHAEVLFICGGCGRTSRRLFSDIDEMLSLVGTDLEHTVTLDKIVEDLYEFEIKREKFKEPYGEGFGKFKTVPTVIYSPGRKPVMKTDHFATMYFNGVFIDNNSPNINIVRSFGTDGEKLQDYLEAWKKKTTEVDMEWALKWLTKDQLSDLYERGIESGWDWDQVGAKYPS